MRREPPAPAVIRDGEIWIEKTALGKGTTAAVSLLAAAKETRAAAKA